MDTSGATPSPPEPSSDSNEPKKYIRTFAGDMEMLKKGGVPDLKPLAPKKETPPNLPGAAAPPPSIPVPAPPTAPPQPPPPPKPDVKTSSPIQTYSGDFSERIKKTGASTTTILAAEGDAGGVKVSEEHSKGGGIAVVVGILLLLTGGAGAYFAYSHYTLVTAPVPILQPTSQTPISVDEREKISGKTPNDLLLAIVQSLTRPLSANSVRLLYTDQSTTTDKSVFSALQLPAPGSLLRNINASNSMAGIVSAGGAESPFFILGVTSYGDTFSGMLAWEPTMSRDLQSIFPLHPAPVVATSTATTTKSKIGTSKTGTATTTKPLTPIYSVFFHDEVVNNHDVRIYRDAQGRSVLLYGYWNQRTLVIARDPAAFIELLGRLATSRAK